MYTRISWTRDCWSSTSSPKISSADSNCRLLTGSRSSQMEQPTPRVANKLKIWNSNSRISRFKWRTRTAISVGCRNRLWSLSNAACINPLNPAALSIIQTTLKAAQGSKRTKASSIPVSTKILIKIVWPRIQVSVRCWEVHLWAIDHANLSHGLMKTIRMWVKMSASALSSKSTRSIRQTTRH